MLPEQAAAGDNLWGGWCKLLLFPKQAARRLLTHAPLMKAQCVTMWTCVQVAGAALRAYDLGRQPSPPGRLPFPCALVAQYITQHLLKLERAEARPYRVFFAVQQQPPCHLWKISIKTGSRPQ
jgi:hypothetical protein